MKEPKMPTPRIDPRAISLDLELHAIERAVLGSRVLLDDVQVDGEQARERLSGSMAVLALVIARLRLIRAAIRREVEPDHLVGFDNTLGATVAPHEDPDVRLPVSGTRRAPADPVEPSRSSRSRRSA